jgi:hypothetical protein
MPWCDYTRHIYYIIKFGSSCGYPKSLIVLVALRGLFYEETQRSNPFLLLVVTIALKKNYSMQVLDII